MDAEWLVGVWGVACRGEQGRVVIPVLLLGLQSTAYIPTTAPGGGGGGGGLTPHHHRLRGRSSHPGVGADSLLHAAQLSDRAPSSAGGVNGGASFPHTSPGGPHNTPAATPANTPSIFDPWHAGIAEGARHGYALTPDGIHIAVSAAHTRARPTGTFMLVVCREFGKHLRASQVRFATTLVATCPTSVPRVV
ncbi:hypothetical protein E2C01_066450 [Portunus trituberculatus]|uniref:Uncharacterized protein n=1 Tax=Portunus trituberculatus TaxID=210409 RepID=A0A5B7HR28_PORTR|nr:hypothetical protein [Portunus trituberculatus]